MVRITVPQPAPVPVPPGAAVAAELFARLLSLGRSRKRKVEDRRHAADRGAEAAEVRRYAQTMMSADPRFAADLFAAADRHERGGE